MIRKIIHIDQDKCNGCGACAAACHEGAIGMVDGKARLLRDDYCDGLGDCLPACPTGAITFVEREAAEYDRAAVEENQRKKAGHPGHKGLPFFGGCPGSRMQTLGHKEAAPAPASAVGQTPSQLGQWPCQIKLVPVNAPYFQGAKLLIAADCTAYAYANMHSQFMRDRLPQAGQRGLQRKAHPDHPGQRHPKRHRGAHGGPLLRRAGDGRQDRPAKQREVHPLAGGDHFDRWADIGLTYFQLGVRSDERYVNS